MKVDGVKMYPRILLFLTFIKDKMVNHVIYKPYTKNTSTTKRFVEFNKFSIRMLR